MTGVQTCALPIFDKPNIVKVKDSGWMNRLAAFFKRLIASVIGAPEDKDATGTDSEDRQITTFDKPVTITIPYNPEKLKNIEPESLKIYYWNEKGVQAGTEKTIPGKILFDPRGRLLGYTSGFSSVERLSNQPNRQRDVYRGGKVRRSLQETGRESCRESV